MKIERLKRKGKIQLPDGTTQEVELEIERKVHNDGRRDVTIKVPSIDSSPSSPTGDRNG